MAAKPPLEVGAQVRPNPASFTHFASYKDRGVVLELDRGMAVVKWQDGRTTTVAADEILIQETRMLRARQLIEQVLRGVAPQQVLESKHLQYRVTTAEGDFEAQVEVPMGEGLSGVVEFDYLMPNNVRKYKVGSDVTGLRMHVAIRKKGSVGYRGNIQLKYAKMPQSIGDAKAIVEEIWGILGGMDPEEWFPVVKQLPGWKVQHENPRH